MLTLHRILHQRQIQVFLLLLFVVSCRKPDQVLPDGPNTINVEATVPALIYSNTKTVYLDASKTNFLNGLRTIYYKWECTGFPAQSSKPDIIHSDKAISTVENLPLGKYNFQLTVKDNLGNIVLSSFVMDVIEDSLVGYTPISKAGPDKVIQAPIHEVILNGSESFNVNPLGRQLFFHWALIQQPVGSGAVEILLNDLHIAKANKLNEGRYTFQLEVKNEYGKSAFDTMEVNVLPDPLKGTSKIYELQEWKLAKVDDDWWNESFAYITIEEPVLFNNRYPGNMEVEIWEEDQQKWVGSPKYRWEPHYWGEYDKGGLTIYFPRLTDVNAYFGQVGKKSRVSVNFL